MTDTTEDTHVMHGTSLTPRISRDEMTLTSPEVAPELQAGAVNQEPEKVEKLEASEVPEKERDSKEQYTSDKPQGLEKQADKVTATAEPEEVDPDLVSIIFDIVSDIFALLTSLKGYF